MAMNTSAEEFFKISQCNNWKHEAKNSAHWKGKTKPTNKKIKKTKRLGKLIEINIIESTHNRNI